MLFVCRTRCVGVACSSTAVLRVRSSSVARASAAHISIETGASSSSRLTSLPQPAAVEDDVRLHVAFHMFTAGASVHQPSLCRPQPQPFKKRVCHPDRGLVVIIALSTTCSAGFYTVTQCACFGIAGSLSPHMIWPDNAPRARALRARRRGSRRQFAVAALRRRPDPLGESSRGAACCLARVAIILQFATAK